VTVLSNFDSLLQRLAGDASSPRALTPALDAFCRGLTEASVAREVRIWLHDRRARELRLTAASWTGATGRGERIATADAHSPIAAALGRDRAVDVGPSDSGAGVRVLVGLRGTRRALGVIAFDGVRAEAGVNGAALTRCEAIGRQLSAVLENVELLDEIIRSRAELQNVFDSLDHLVVVFSARGLIVNVNRACASRLGATREALVDRGVSEVLTGEVGEWVHTQLSTARVGPPAALDDAQLGGRFEVTLAPLAGGESGPNGHVLVARDVTTATRLERERADLERRLSQSAKLLALGQFVAGVAHELNNPLQGVLGHLELIRRSKLPGPVARDLSVVYREADRAARIVRNLLVFAGSGRLTRRPVSLNRIVTEVLRLRGPHLRTAGIETACELDAALPLVSGDRLLLQQAIVNLVVNAEQAMASGGRLTVRTERGAQGVRVVVTDSGCGMDDEVRARLFEPFFTTREGAGGTGLGLAIVYGIVNAHGGTIDVGSSPGTGASFCITLTPASRRIARG
jgi:PAS domain S-box-containing protein